MISTFTLSVIAITLIGVFLWAVLLYNRMQKYQQILNEEKQNIVASLKQRHDAIPKLVEIIGENLAHEKLVHESSVVIRYLQEASSKGRLLDNQNTLNNVEQALKNILMLSEEYPELMTSESVLRLAQELVKTENQIAASRRLYNRIAALSLEQFGLIPNRYFIVAFGFMPEPFIEFDLAHIPTVTFTNN